MGDFFGAGITVLILAIIAIGIGVIILIAGSFMKNDKRVVEIGKWLVLSGSLGLLVSLTLCSVGLSR